MARIAYPDPNTKEITPLVDRIIAERGKLANLYRMLLHSPPIAEGWLNFLTAIRHKCSLSGRIRELVILQIAVINGAGYEFRAHEPIALQEGVTQQQINALRVGDPSYFDASDKHVLKYCESMTRDVQVPDPVFNAMRKHLNEREVVELTATIAAYNLVSRFLEAIQVDHE
jgi:AhpD family alkylhydroperoxidase